MEYTARDELIATLVVLFGEQIARDPQLTALLDKVIVEEASAYATEYRRAADARVQQLNAQVEAQAAEYNNALTQVREQAIAGSQGDLQNARGTVDNLSSELERVTTERDELQSTIDGLADRIRAAQAAARAQLEEAQNRVAELEESIAANEHAPVDAGMVTVHAAQMTAITEAITDAMAAYRARTDAITSENEAVARNEDAKLTAAVRKAFHAVSHQK